jgi:5,10-methenyltetrahydrofolate synthetase
MGMLSEDNTAWRRTMRRQMIECRSALSAEQHAEFSARIVTHIRAAFAPPLVAAFCWPIKQEPDVRALLAAWQEEGVKAALPVVVAEQSALAFREWTAHSQMAVDRYGIPTPQDGDWLHPDLILLPLNGFDAAGYRLGYGGGYFDRTLAALAPRPLTIGVGFELNRLLSIRPEAHDQRLDWVVTEQGVFRSGV